MRPFVRSAPPGRGDQHQGGAPAGGECEQQVDDLPSGFPVEVAGRLVGQKQARLGRDGAGERNALLFAARQLRRVMREAMAEPDRVEFGRGQVEGVRASGQLERHGDILQRRHRRDQVKRLEHDPERVAAEQGERVLVHSRKVTACNLDAPGCRLLQAGNHHHHRGLAGP
jgi:hypothetical protein